jgi:RES domain-containing protein
MPEFTKADEYSRFAFSVRRQCRYIYSDDVRNFLDAVLDTCGKRDLVLPKGSELYRAQRGCREVKFVAADSTKPSRRSLSDASPWETEYLTKSLPYSVKRMFPRSNQGVEGRANPKGISYLYLATDLQTATSEMRPAIASSLTLAKCRTRCDLRLVDCSWESMSDNLLRPSPDSYYEKLAWYEIDKAFSKPVENTDDLADYVPTQVLAESFRHHGYQGIVYKSTMAIGGKNVALFDVTKVRIIERRVFRAMSVEYRFKAEPPARREPRPTKDKRLEEKPESSRERRRNDPGKRSAGG